MTSLVIFVIRDKYSSVMEVLARNTEVAAGVGRSEIVEPVPLRDLPPGVREKIWSHLPAADVVRVACALGKSATAEISRDILTADPALSLVLDRTQPRSLRHDAVAALLMTRSARELGCRRRSPGLPIRGRYTDLPSALGHRTTLLSLMATVGRDPRIWQVLQAAWSRRPVARRVPIQNGAFAAVPSARIDELARINDASAQFERASDDALVQYAMFRVVGPHQHMPTSPLPMPQNAATGIALQHELLRRAAAQPIADRAPLLGRLEMLMHSCRGLDVPSETQYIARIATSLYPYGRLHREFSAYLAQTHQGSGPQA